MMRTVFAMLLIGASLLQTVDVAAAEPATPLAQSPAAALLARPATLRGTLGDAKVQMHLRLKVPADEGIEGDYFLFGQNLNVLLAGETENDVLTMEESENGSDISGQWNGKIEGRIIRGTWSSADGSVTKHFELTVVPTAATAVKKVASKKIAGSSIISR